MSVREDPPKERSAAAFAIFMYNHVRLRLPRQFYKNRLKAYAINKGCSASILEFGFTDWPRDDHHHRLSIHSDPQGSVVGYGVFRPEQSNDLVLHQQITEYLKRSVGRSRRPTPVLWAWYEEMAEPLRDFSWQGTWIEVEKIGEGEESEGADTFRRASHNLARLAVALDECYSKAG